MRVLRLVIENLLLERLVANTAALALVVMRREGNESAPLSRGLEVQRVAPQETARGLFCRGAGLPNFFTEAAVTSSELDKGNLRFGQAAAICAAGVEGKNSCDASSSQKQIWQISEPGVFSSISRPQQGQVYMLKAAPVLRGRRGQVLARALMALATARVCAVPFQALASEALSG